MGGRVNDEDRVIASGRKLSTWRFAKTLHAFAPSIDYKATTRRREAARVALRHASAEDIERALAKAAPVARGMRLRMEKASASRD